MLDIHNCKSCRLFLQGACRHWVPAAKATAQAEDGAADNAGATDNDNDGGSSPNRTQSPPKRTMSVAPTAANLARMQSMAHTGTAPSMMGVRTSGRPGRKSKMLHKEAIPSIKELQPQVCGYPKFVSRHCMGTSAAVALICPSRTSLSVVRSRSSCYPATAISTNLHADISPASSLLLPWHRGIILLVCCPFRLW